MVAVYITVNFISFMLIIAWGNLDLFAQGGKFTPDF